MEHDENKLDISLSGDDIVEYYKNLEKETTDHTPQEDIISEEFSSKNTSEPQILSSEPESEDNIYESNAEEFADFDERKKNILFFVITSGLAALTLLVFFLIGTASEKAEEDINFELAHIETTSKNYLDAQKSISDAEEKLDVLQSEIDEVQEELNILTEYESNTGEVKSKLNVLNDEMDNLKDEIASREKTVTNLDSSIASKSLTSFTLTPGIYTAGKNIKSGKYNVTGDGIMTISDDKGALRANTLLGTEPFTCQIADNDIIKTETTAAFIPFQ